MSERTLIGKVESVSGGKVSVLLDDRIKSTMPIINGVVYRVGQIGSFVKIPLGYAHLFGIVTQAGAAAIPERISEKFHRENNSPFINNRWITVVLVGERIADRFERGVAQYPTSDDEVHLVTIEDLALIYGKVDPNSSIQVGQISASESLPARIDLNKLITRHCAILGSTGSGKSNAVSIILQAIASNSILKSRRILVIDPHGEYSDVLEGYCKVIKVNAEIAKGESELVIPFWALPFEELISIFPGKLNDAQKDYVRQDLVKKKIAASKYLKSSPPESSVSSDSPIPFSLKKLWFDLDDFERTTFSDTGRTIKTELVEIGDAATFKSNKYTPASAGGGAPFLNNRAQGILYFLESLRNRATDDRFKFLFDPGKYNPDFEGKLNGTDIHELLIEWLGHEKPITILDLSGIPPEIMISISGTLLRIIYDALYRGQNLPVGGRKQPLLITLEEAHNYLKAGEDSIASRTVQTISKEGRKYGVGLLLVTQRPSELDETVLSQCGSIIALRMTNSKDRSHISSAVQDDLLDLVSILPSIRTGEGLILGDIVKIPSRVKFEKTARAHNSSDPNVTLEWMKDIPDSKEYEKVVELWRNGKFKY